MCGIPTSEQKRRIRGECTLFQKYSEILQGKKLTMVIHIKKTLLNND